MSRRVASSALFCSCRAVLARKRAFSRWCPGGQAPTLWRGDGRTPPAAITPLHVRFSREFGGASLSEPPLTARRTINARAFDCGRRHAAGSAGVTTPSDGRTSATPGRAWHPFLSPLSSPLPPSLSATRRSSVSSTLFFGEGVSAVIARCALLTDRRHPSRRPVTPGGGARATHRTALFVLIARHCLSDGDDTKENPL